MAEDRRWKVANKEELDVVLAEIRAKHPSSFLIFRGQDNYYPAVRSGRARANLSGPRDVERSWDALIARVLSASGKRRADFRTRRAILQHYGLATHFLDVTTDPDVATWFACHKYVEQRIMYGGNDIRQHFEADLSPISDGLGYVIVFVVDDPGKLKKEGVLFDITDYEPFVRPKHQSGWLFYDNPPVLPDPNAFWRYTIEVDRATYKHGLTKESVFPHYRDDEGYAFLASLPYVQVPTAGFDDQKGASGKSRKASKPAIKSPSEMEPAQLMREMMTFGERLLRIPEHYPINHKYNDVTIHEPHSMRQWYRWSFPLKDLHPGVDFDIGQATKITVAPGAWQFLRRSRNRDLGWPEIGHDNVLFTFAEMDSDVADEHGPNYDGVWLVRKGDLLVEHPVVADPLVMTVMGGHGFLLWDKNLQHRMVPNACPCGKPDTHLRRVKALLRASSLIRRSELSLLPHPQVPKWYFLL